MRHVRLADGLLVDSTADDPDALVLFTAAEARDAVLRRDRITQDVVDATAAAQAAQAEPTILRQLAAVILGRARSPLEPQE